MYIFLAGVLTGIVGTITVFMSCVIIEYVEFKLFKNSTSSILSAQKKAQAKRGTSPCIKY